MKTLADLFLKGLQGRPDRPRMADPAEPVPDGGLVWLTGEEIRTRVARLARGLQECGLNKGDRIAILSENRSDWALLDYAAQSLGLVVVPLYPNESAESFRYILHDCGARWAVVSGEAHARTLHPLRDDLPRLETVAAMEESPGPADLTLAEVEADASSEILAELAMGVSEEDLASLVYTSGTTGHPKGVMLSHGNIVSNVRSATRVLPLLASDVAFSFLPLSHIFERTVDYSLWQAGAALVYSPRVEWVMPLMPEVRPTFFAGVPRLYEKVFQRIREKALDGDIFHRMVFLWARHVASEHAAHELEGTSDPGALARRWADRLVWSKVRDAFGGKVRLCLNGGAPLRRDVCRFFWGCGLEIYGGYGLTEAAPILCTSYPGNVKCHTVGPCLPGQELRIEKDGEVLARGPNVMQGYWNDAEATREVLGDGWLRTGDLGHLDGDGHLVIVGRKKEILVTSGGKNVAPVRVEDAIKGNELVEDAMLVGDGRKFVSVLLVPAEGVLRAWAEDQELVPEAPWEELLAHEDVRRLYQDLTEELTAHLSPHERPKKVALLPRSFLFAEGELTATGKLRRAVIEAHFAAEIDALYRRP